MSTIGNLMRSASNELNQYILAENERLAATVHGQMETPPDYHDQQTCYELQIEAKAVDTLTARVAELEVEAVALSHEVELTKKGWININDKMPQQGEYLLTLDDIGRQFESQLFFYGDEDRPEFKVISTVWEHSNVTHWKILPYKVKS